VRIALGLMHLGSLGLPVGNVADSSFVTLPLGSDLVVIVPIADDRVPILFTPAYSEKPLAFSAS
jgi:hypothetical protein